MIVPLYPSYYAPDFPQNTISPTAIKFYNKFRSVKSEALDWIRLVDEVGTKAYLRNDHSKIRNFLTMSQSI